mmetsp:Transcript_44061/g.136513  ORF Transcript_44061/g.136513 Transcript_44061/m.136513 type:complete len:357 (-) Transcript_44061:363-1433(-)
MGSIVTLASALLLYGASFAHSTQFLQGRNSTTAIAAHQVNATQAPTTFRAFYDAHASGRGIWKWSNALDSYQRHFASWVGQEMALAEVGVQSGGSILMWKAVLGKKCVIYGIDINPACQQFMDHATSITIMDQGDMNAWKSFFTTLQTTGRALDILVDDGSHLPQHMALTLHAAFPHIKAGGYVAVEDIHGRHYMCSFFYPSARSIGHWYAQALVASVHLYPFQLLVHKAGDQSKTYVPGPASATVSEFSQLWPALNMHPGGFIYMQNPAWGYFLAEPALRTIFATFAPLHDYRMVSHPAGCERTAAAVCTVGIMNSQSQAQIVGVHIYPTYLAVEVAAKPPVIAAVRRGTDFIPY